MSKTFRVALMTKDDREYCYSVQQANSPLEAVQQDSQLYTAEGLQKAGASHFIVIGSHEGRGCWRYVIQYEGDAFKLVDHETKNSF